ncbi:MAG TPA: cupin domain-containing protein [Solirubrobacteraceae bacterium]|nr:cupin domain-containing protein [Solirubrobacteraceae bacterium]
MKQEFEFFAAHDHVWEPGLVVGTEEKVLSRDPDDPEILTRLVRWQPGFDTNPAGVITHDWVEEVYILAGELLDITLGRSFAAGHYACRRPQMPHGPYRSATGCTMLEIRYRP